MDPVLKLVDIYKMFYGLTVLNGIDLSIERGEKHALIGPNGAGKSTIFNIITGRMPPSRGKVFFNDRLLTGLPIHKIALLGIARSFQITNIFPDMTVFENVINAVASKRRCSMRLFPKLNRISAISDEAERVLGLLRLDDIKCEIAGNLAYGQQRALELGLTMALDPEVILLDEPTAGMTNEESHEIVGLMNTLAKSKTLVIIEHDIDVVFNLADRISVLHHGRIIATGTPNQIKSSNAVKEAYLGKSFDE